MKLWHNPALQGSRTTFVVQLAETGPQTPRKPKSWLFFAWHQGAWAFAGVLLLLTLIAAFWPIRRLAAVLLLPCTAWVCLASALTWSVWQNNPGLL